MASELAKVAPAGFDPYRALRTKPWEEVVSDVLTLIHTATKVPYGKDLSPDLLAVWVIVLSKASATVDELIAAADHFVCTEDFPSPGKAAEWIEDHRLHIRAQAQIDALKAELKKEREDHLASIRAEGLDPESPVSLEQASELRSSLGELPGRLAPGRRRKGAEPIDVQAEELRSKKAIIAQAKSQRKKGA